MIAKVTIESTSRTGMDARTRKPINRNIKRPCQKTEQGGRSPLAELIPWASSALDRPVSDAWRAREGVGMQFIVLLLVLRHIHALTEDVVFRPVEHEDRGARRDIGEALVDDQSTRVLGESNGVDVLSVELLELLHLLDALVRVLLGDELFHNIDELLLEGQQVDGAVFAGAVERAGLRADRRQRVGVL